MELTRVDPDWAGEGCVVVASGPGLTTEVAETCRRSGWRVIVVNDAHRLLPFADLLYACDARWWIAHDGVPAFQGERWTTHESSSGGHVNDKSDIAERYGLRCVRGADGEGFSTDPRTIHYGSNSGFQAINLALLKGCTRVALCGFDMRHVNGQAHFFGPHPAPLATCTDYRQFLPAFDRAAQRLPAGVRIYNCTPGSALRCFEMTTLDELFSRAEWQRDARPGGAKAVPGCAWARTCSQISAQPAGSRL